MTANPLELIADLIMPDGRRFGDVWSAWQADAFRVEYRAALRYRPAGFPGTSIPANGQVALFNTSGPLGFDLSNGLIVTIGL